MALGKQVKKYRDALGWTLETLSIASGVEVGTIGALEVRDSGRSKFAASLAAAMGLSLDQLLDEQATHTPRPRQQGHSCSDRSGAYIVNKAPATKLEDALDAIAEHAQGLDPSGRAAAAALLAHLCTHPEDRRATKARLASLRPIELAPQQPITTI